MMMIMKSATKTRLSTSKTTCSQHMPIKSATYKVIGPPQIGVSSACMVSVDIETSLWGARLQKENDESDHLRLGR